MLKIFLKDRTDNPIPINIEQYNKEIDQAMDEVKKAKCILMMKWLKWQRAGNGKKENNLD